MKCVTTISKGNIYLQYHEFIPDTLSPNYFICQSCDLRIEDEVLNDLIVRSKRKKLKEDMQKAYEKAVFGVDFGFGIDSAVGTVMPPSYYSAHIFSVNDVEKKEKYKPVNKKRQLITKDLIMKECFYNRSVKFLEARRGHFKESEYQYLRSFCY